MKPFTFSVWPKSAINVQLVDDNFSIENIFILHSLKKKKKCLKLKQKMFFFIKFHSYD